MAPSKPPLFDLLGDVLADSPPLLLLLFGEVWLSNVGSLFLKYGSYVGMDVTCPLVEIKSNGDDISLEDGGGG
ncbi:hypothetical protein BLA29_013748 [Euroglyphus maynei]|uniref:Uncharacterized protein n=1 Tax=Euroglyphus maynei TaxID=6958 RepID=A0A1Y3BM92_EURMA|nr:hypothetical protein BLA29_013748 [Euroglyphus maynei]